MSAEPIALPAVSYVDRNPSPRLKRVGLAQAYELREIAAHMAFALRDDIKSSDGKLTVRRDEFGKPVDAAALAQLIRAWAEADERARIARGRPLPGSLRPERKPKVKKRAPVIAPVVAEEQRTRAQSLEFTQPSQPAQPLDVPLTD